MALPKKKARKISIDGELFHYSISRSKTANDGEFQLTISAQNENSTGTCLIAKGIHTRDFWLDFGDVQKHAPNAYKILTPKHVEKIIREGIRLGWRSAQSTGLFEMNVYDSFIES